MKDTADRIRALMREQQITPKMLAGQLRVSYPAMINYLHAKRWLNLSMLREVCQILDVSADYLLGLSTTVRHPDELPPEEQQLLALYRTLPPDGRDYALIQLRQLDRFCRKIQKHPI